jgi:hypothetical protein
LPTFDRPMNTTSIHRRVATGRLSGARVRSCAVVIDHAATSL